MHWPANGGLDGSPGADAAARAVVEALEAAKAAGKVRHWGYCNFGTADMAAFGAGAVSNQLPYNLLWRSIEDGILPHCRKHDIAVLCYSSL
ncbi:aldo/keto reductase, partial [bacterium]|nr:aldo/keto reductase [bacterium]